MQYWPNRWLCHVLPLLSLDYYYIISHTSFCHRKKKNDAHHAYSPLKLNFSKNAESCVLFYSATDTILFLGSIAKKWRDWYRVCESIQMLRVHNSPNLIKYLFNAFSNNFVHFFFFSVVVEQKQKKNDRTQ